MNKLLRRKIQAFLLPITLVDDVEIVYSQKIREKHKKRLPYSKNLLGKFLPLSNKSNPHLRVTFLIVIQYKK